LASFAVASSLNSFFTSSQSLLLNSITIILIFIAGAAGLPYSRLSGSTPYHLIWPSFHACAHSNPWSELIPKHKAIVQESSEEQQYLPWHQRCAGHIAPVVVLVDSD